MIQFQIKQYKKKKINNLLYKNKIHLEQEISLVIQSKNQENKLSELSLEIKYNQIKVKYPNKMSKKKTKKQI